MPDWDQWDAEAVELFIPWFEDDHFLTHLVSPHNEHRVVLTKLQNLAIGLINGQWDSRLEAVVNALLHAAIAVALWLLGRRSITGPRQDRPLSAGSVFLCAVLFVVTLPLFALPLAWQNVLGGFHSQQYWLIGLSLAAIVTLPFTHSWSAPWWLGSFAAILTLGSMASGFLAAAVVVVVILFRMLRHETTLRASWPALFICAGVITVGFLTRFEPSWHQEMKATTVHDFVFSIVHSAQWPQRPQNWAAPVMWAPWVIAAVVVFRSKPGTQRVGQVIVALGGWVLVQLVATAYARGAGADYPASRYMDTLAFGVLTNAIALAWLMSEQWRDASPRRSRILLALLALGWMVTLGFGLRRLSYEVLAIELPGVKSYYLRAEANLRRYLATDDRKELAYPEVPYPNVDGLIDRLANRHLRALMPVPVRPPLPLAAASSSTGFVENDGRGSYNVPTHFGLSPATPPHDAARSWGSHGAESGAAAVGTWRSAPLTPTKFRWLKFDVAGTPGDRKADVRLELRDAATDAFLGIIRPNRLAGDGWRPVYVAAPRRPFVVQAIDASPTQWLAFTGPTEMGLLSYWAMQATRHGWVIAYGGGVAGAVLFLFLIGRRLKQRKRESATPTSAASTA